MPLLQGRSLAVPFLATLAAGFIAFFLAPDAQAQALTASVTLTWTATGDDGYIGRATKYDFRYSARPVSGSDTLGWWNTAAAVSMTSRAPAPSGSRDSLRLGGLVVGIKYYAILRIGDDAGNWSGFSNMAIIDLTHGATAVEEEVGPAPKLVVGAPYPSPTNGRAQISLSLARSGPVEVAVFDARGRRIRSLETGIIGAGPHLLRWDGNAESGARAAAGVYWIQVAAEGTRKSVKLVVVH